MALKPLVLRYLLWSSASVALAYNATLPSQLKETVPECAWACVKSFIEHGYRVDQCGKEPSMQCLCSKRATSGYTIGEGAVQCIVAGDETGFCPRQDVDGDVPQEAYAICDDFPRAVSNTHSTLSATLYIPTSGSDISVVVPTTISGTTRTTTTTTGRTTTTTSVTRPTSKTSSSSSSITTATTTSPATTTRASSTFQTSTLVTETASPQPNQSSEPSSPTTLASAQIAGISIGIAGAIALALGAIFLARRMRRRNFPEYDDEFDGHERKRLPDEPGSRMTRIFHISPPVFRFSKHADNNCPSRPTSPIPPPPPLYSSLENNQIGLAISRPRSGATTDSPEPPPLRRKHSRLLPAKPNLTLAIPTADQAESTASQPPTSTQPTTDRGDRASMMTNVTAFADLDSAAAENGNIWRPPPSDPQSATAYYIADRWGNWVLNTNNRESRDVAQVAPPAELDTYTPFTKSPIEKEEEEAASAMAAAISAASGIPRQPPPAFLSQDPASKPMSVSRSSSLYSQASAVRVKGRSYGPSAGGRRNSASRKDSANRMSRADSKRSIDSTTTINTSSPGPFDDDRAAFEDASRLSVLSPVVESPLIGIGRKALANPRLPGRLDGATIRMVAPPKRPNFSSSPPGQPSPTLGAVVPPVHGSPSAYPLPLNPRRNQWLPPQQQQGTGSGFSPTPPTAAAMPPTSAPMQRMAGPPRSVQPGLTSMPAPPNNNNNNYYYRQPPPTAQQQQQQPYNYHQSPVMMPSPSSHRPPHVASQHIVSPVSAATASSAASSLLAKRVGNDRAATLAIDPNGDPSKRRTNEQQKWRRGGGAGGGPMTPDPNGQRQPPGSAGTLPVTPGWQPRLTPTRRGDDLFLSVR